MLTFPCLSQHQDVDTACLLFEFHAGLLPGDYRIGPWYQQKLTHVKVKQQKKSMVGGKGAQNKNTHYNNTKNPCILFYACYNNANNHWWEGVYFTYIRYMSFLCFDPREYLMYWLILTGARGSSFPLTIKVLGTRFYAWEVRLCHQQKAEVQKWLKQNCTVSDICFFILNLQMTT